MTKQRIGAGTPLADTGGLDRYMREIRRYPLLSRDEEQALARRLRATGDAPAAHRLVTGNLRFVVKLAHSFRGYGLRALDLIQEGNLGLMLAVKNFDPERGYRLISYAVWWIRAQMQNFILRSWSMVRMGSSRLQRQLFFKLRGTRARAEAQAQATGRSVELVDLAAQLATDARHVSAMDLRLAARDFSLDAPIGTEEAAETTHLDRLPSPTADQESQLGAAEEKAQLRRAVALAVATLNDKERAIVTRRMLSEAPETLQALGTDLGVSRERVRQLEQRVLSKLRTALAPLREYATATPA